MKKNIYCYIILLATLTMLGCSNDNELLPLTMTSNISNESNYRRSISEALNIAQNSIVILEGNEKSANVNRRHSSTLPSRRVNSSPVIIGHHNGNLHRGYPTTNDTLMYVFNYDDNQGFAIISADSRTEGLIAITDQGHYEQNETNKIEGFSMFMKLAEEYIEKKSTNNYVKLKKKDDFILRKDSTYQSEQYYGPYITVKWGQTYPEGMFCNNGYSGCANTAMAQIMSYYEFPTSIYLSYSGADRTIQELNWTEIKKHITHMNHYNCIASDEVHHAIGSLCKQLVTLNNSDDNGTNGTSTMSSSINATYTNIGYQTSGWINYNDISGELFSHLYNHRVMQIRGAENGEDVGHTWVLDGAYVLFIEHFSWTKPAGMICDWTLDYHTTETHAYYHFNWGFDGENNGYFYGGVFDTSNGINYDTPYNYQSFNFNTNVKILVVYI